MLRGRVRLVSLSPDEKQRYILEADVDATHFEGILQEGMEGTLTVLVEQRPIAAYVLETFLRPFQSLIR